jgi:hypothetical protein
MPPNNKYKTTTKNMKIDRLLCVEDLLTDADTASPHEIQDQIRRIVSASEVRFRNGGMALTHAGTAQLAQAVIEDRIKGNAAKAHSLLDEINNPPSGPVEVLTLKGVRHLCQQVIDGSVEGDAVRAQGLLDQFNRDYPNS